MSKKALCETAKIARTTFDSILKGADAKISTIETIAKILNVPVGYLFEEDSTGRGVSIDAEFSAVAMSTGNATATFGDAVLAERVKSLEQLVSEKDERIKELKERIEELKVR